MPHSVDNTCSKKKFKVIVGRFRREANLTVYFVTISSNLRFPEMEVKMMLRRYKQMIFVKSISKCCEQRCDEWSYNVKEKIEFFSSDLHAADAVYYRSCCVNFRTGRQIPVQYIDGKKQKVR